MAECLSNVVVLRKILQHFTNSELFRLSVVNKLWNYEARSVMKNRGNIVARLRFHDYRPCQEQLDALAADLGCMNVIPVSGIRIYICHYHSSCQVAAPHSTYENILGKLQFKSVTVQLTGDWCKNKVCPGSLLATKALQHFSDVLEEVSLDTFGSEEDNIILGFVKDFRFPRLKILKVGQNFYGENGTRRTTILKALLAGSQTLQELHTPGPINLMLNVLDGRSTVVFVHQALFNAPYEYDNIPENSINTIRLERIKLHYIRPGFDLERFNRITPILLQVSRLAIKSMEIDLPLAVPLMCYGIRLENVRQLTMYINPSQMEVDEHRIWRIFKDFDFTRIFPKLEKVVTFPPSVYPKLSADHVNRFVEQADASLQEPSPDRAINIQELDLSTSISSAAEFYAEMFPNIERLSLRRGDGVASLGSIWKHWVNLKKLFVKAEVQKHVEDLESFVCGIFPEEVAELRQKDEEFLKKVNIVPVMPAITCLRNLREFVLILKPKSHPLFGFPSPCHVEPESSTILSQVTGLIAFARCPNLNVLITAYGVHVYEALRQVKPYASVFNILPEEVE